MRSLRPPLQLTVLLAFEAAAVLLLHRLGATPWLSAPAPGEVGAWLAAAAPEDALAAALRLVALGCAWWLLASTVLYVLARLSGLPRLVAGVRWATLPGVRRLADRAVAVVLTTSAVMGSGGPALAQQLATPPAFAGAAPSAGHLVLVPPGAAFPLAVPHAGEVAASSGMASTAPTSAVAPAGGVWSATAPPPAVAAPDAAWSTVPTPTVAPPEPAPPAMTPLATALPVGLPPALAPEAVVPSTPLPDRPANAASAGEPAVAPRAVAPSPPGLSLTAPSSVPQLGTTSPSPAPSASPSPASTDGRASTEAEEPIAPPVVSATEVHPEEGRSSGTVRPASPASGVAGWDRVAGHGPGPLGPGVLGPHALADDAVWRPMLRSPTVPAGDASAAGGSAEAPIGSSGSGSAEAPIRSSGTGPVEAVGGPPSPEPQVREHRVTAGEHLWAIAARVLADERGVAASVLSDREVHAYWIKLVGANRSNVASGDPDVVRVGEVLVIPPPD